MKTWPGEELAQIGSTDDLHISPLREDGITLGTPTWIWSVVVDGSLYVRPYHGPKSRWHQAAIRQGAGQIRAAGLTRQVRFEPAPDEVNAKVDRAYRARYGDSPYLGAMIAPPARAATVKILPIG